MEATRQLDARSDLLVQHRDRHLSRPSVRPSRTILSRASSAKLAGQGTVDECHSEGGTRAQASLRVCSQQPHWPTSLHR